ncbi:DUF1707 and FHA domain-containing protein [Streptomyces sp. DSM 44915]|uniref:DUF1707 and FHA domain-containing protein n=1 Tax=Streptomyces chisholmiae TaxID=3075540 RepID=A0ABU2JNK6_9ACTN|nr:DUF1707 and FHA domain-containing protein [Streptomyces sp. DSM 44915]MDT0266304.1 DUF1707 and FHA domain-containing protein [Streptomyces sp. DSM 44915]
MTTPDSEAQRPRISDADREEALEVLREGMAEGRISPDTLLQRVELIMAARHPDELAEVLHDLPDRRAPRSDGWLLTSVTRISAFQHRLRLAWRAERLPQLVLPLPGPKPLAIGRAAGSGLRLNDASVSRYHAQLRGTAAGWTLRDLGSANGTWVNGRRVTDTVPVRAGDQLRFGAVSYRLVAREPGT